MASAQVHVIRASAAPVSHDVSSDCADQEDLRLAARTDVPVLVTAERADQRKACARHIHAARTLGRELFVTYRGNGIDAPVHDDGGPGDCRDEQGMLLKFDQARGGTLFIEEVVAMTAVEQACLLRLLEGQAASRRASGPTLVRRTARIVAGADRRLDAARASGAFSESLFYRLNVIHIDLIGHDGGARDPSALAV